MTSCFAFREMSIIKIESRPSAVATAPGSQLTNRKHWDLVFFIDYEPSDNPATNLALLTALREFCLWVRELGHYYSGMQHIEAAPAQWKGIMDVIGH